jgi:hypothetical protein
MYLTTKRIGVSVGLFAVTFALTNIAQADGGKQPSAAAKDTARTLLIDCRDKLGKKDHQAALKSCKGAHSIMGVPTTGLDLAKVQQAMGLFVEARETALEVVRFDNSSNNAAYTQAQADANRIAQDLEKRIPSLVITVSGLPAGTTAHVVVDKEDVPEAAMSLPYRVNPGEHTVVASAKDLPDATRTLTISEGQTVPLDLSMTKGSDAEPDKPSPGRKIPVWAWAVGGVGLLGAGGAVFFGIDFGDTKQKVDRDCPNNQCRPEYTAQQAQDLQSHWNRSLVLTVVSSTVAAGCLGAAIYGIVTAPKKTESATRITPWVGGGVSGAVVSGSF